MLLLRDGPQVLEVLMTRRSMTASFAPCAYVFSGGGIDASDAAPDNFARALRRPTQEDMRLTHVIAAIRESVEKLGILLARHDDGQYAIRDDQGTAAALSRFNRSATNVDASYMQQQGRGSRQLVFPREIGKEPGAVRVLLKANRFAPLATRSVFLPFSHSPEKERRR